MDIFLDTKFSTYGKIQISFFDDINKFREFIYDLRGENHYLPLYAKGNFDRGMINAFITTNMDERKRRTKLKKIIAGEFIEIKGVN